MFSLSKLVHAYFNSRYSQIVQLRTRAVKRAASAAVENLEGRTLFSATFDPGNTFATALNIGDLNGQQTFNGALSGNNLTDFYKFTMPRGGMFLNRFRTNVAGTEIDLFHEQLDSHGNAQEIPLGTGIATPDTPNDGFDSGDLQGRFLNTGTYYVEVSERGFDTPYLLGLTADYAGDSLKNARDIGSATDATFQDFIGTNPSPGLNDPFDVYKVKMDAPGQLAARLSLDNTNTNSANALVQLIHDSNGNGVVDAGDLLLSAAPGTVTLTSLKVPAGTYFVRVEANLNSSNYHLNINADYAGSTAGTVRAAGSIDKLKSFNDFISTTSDSIDDYSFTVSGNRPLFLSASEPGGQMVLILYKDTNNNGVADPSEAVTSTSGSSFNTILHDIGPGHYIARIQGTSGQGTYTIAMETRPDGAGNTLNAAKNLGTTNGLTHLDDYVSGNDTTDFYKFTASAAGMIGADIFTEFGGDANLALIKDANNNGVVDKNELLATATLSKSSDAKEFVHAITAGNYFLRVTVNATMLEIARMSTIQVAKYFVSFQTDYAGSTPKTARSVGTLSGTKNFDDWASGPFTGAISDTADVYKFSLSSTKTFSAKMIGLLGGQDLDLQLYRDKNNDGALSSSELITSSHKLNSPNESFSKSLAAGTYYVKVVGVNGETNYHLTLKA